MGFKEAAAEDESSRSAATELLRLLRSLAAGWMRACSPRSPIVVHEIEALCHLDAPLHGLGVGVERLGLAHLLQQQRLEGAQVHVLLH